MAIRLERHGSGDPLLLLHGLGGDRTTWRPVVARLAERHEVVVCELPGFGASPPLPHDVEPTPAALAAAVAATLTDEDVPGAHLAGVSLGAWVALEMGLAGAGRSVTALCPAGFWPRALAPVRGTAHRLSRRLDPLVPGLMRPRPVRRLVLGGMLGGPGVFSARDATDLVRAYGRATDFPRINAAMRSHTFGETSRLDRLAARVPVHVAWGEHDRLVAPPRRPFGPDVTVHRLAGCGHMPMFDDPDAVAELLLRVTGGGTVTAAVATDGREPAGDTR